MNIPNEAVEAAAEGAWTAGRPGDAREWGVVSEIEKDAYRTVARAALEAAYPTIRHMAAREALDGLIAKHDQSASRHPEGSSAHFDEQRATFRIMAYRDAEYPEAD